MSEPTRKMRLATYERDGNRCVSCGSESGLQYQHRAAEGMGGRHPQPLIFEGLTSCGACNPAYEGVLQGRALRYGWKVRRWVRDLGHVDMVPVFYAWERRWCVLDWDGGRMPVSDLSAMAMMVEVYGLYEFERMVKAA